MGNRGQFSNRNRGGNYRGKSHGQRGSRCYKCGMQGHFARNCQTIVPEEQPNINDLLEKFHLIAERMERLHSSQNVEQAPSRFENADGIPQRGGPL